MQLDESLYEPSRLNLRMEDFTAALRTGQLDAFLRIVSAITGHTREEFLRLARERRRPSLPLIRGRKR